MYEQMVLSTLDSIAANAPTGKQLQERLLDLCAESRMLEREYLAGHIFGVLEDNGASPSALRALEEWLVHEEVPPLSAR